MKSTMSMNLDTTWGNRVILSVEAELDNAHDLQAGEIARIQVDTLSMMVNEVRVQNERALEIRNSAEVRERERVPEPPPERS